MSLVLLKMKKDVLNRQKEKQTMKSQALYEAQCEIKKIFNDKEEYKEMTTKFWVEIEEIMKELDMCKEDDYSKCFYTIKRLYNLLTTNQNYSMSYTEFIENICEIFHLYLCSRDLSELKKSIDPNDLNTVDFEQFIYWYRQFKPKMSNNKVPTCIKLRKLLLNDSEKKKIEKRIIQQIITLKYIEQMLNAFTSKYEMIFNCPVCHSFEEYRYSKLCKHIVVCRKNKENQNRKISTGSVESYFEFNRRNRRSNSCKVSNCSSNDNRNSQNII